MKRNSGTGHYQTNVNLLIVYVWIVLEGDLERNFNKNDQDSLRIQIRSLKLLIKFCEINKEGIRKNTKKLDKHDKRKDRDGALMPQVLEKMKELELGSHTRCLKLLIMIEKEYKDKFEGEEEEELLKEVKIIEEVERAEKKKESFLQKYSKTIILILSFTGLMVLPIFLTPIIDQYQSDITTILILSFPIAFCLGFANGGNDICNSVGTVYGAKVLSMKSALLWGILFEVIGALSMGQFVAKTISKGIVEPEVYEDEPNMFAICMLGVLAGTAITTLCATIYALPISATHGVIAGLVATGLASKGVDAIGVSGLIFTVISWVASPLVGLLITLLFYYIILRFIERSAQPGPRSTCLQPAFSLFSVSLSALFVLLKGLHMKPVWLAVTIAVVFGAIVALVIFLIRKKIEQWFQPVVASIEERLKVAQLNFVPLLIISAFAMALAHGANDVGNSVGPLISILNIQKEGEIEEKVDIPWWGLLIGAAAFGVGIFFLGRLTVETVGSGLSKLDPMKSFAIQLGAGMAVLFSSLLGMPVSTSHCIVGSTIGGALASKIATNKGENLNLGMIKKIIFGWVTTIPLAAGAAVYYYYAQTGALLGD